MAWWKGDGRTARQVEEWNRQLLDDEAHQHERDEADFAASPAGQARTCFDREDEMFQVSVGLDDVSRIPVAISDDGVVRRAEDISDVLDSIVREGWFLHSFATAYVPRGATVQVETMRASVSGQLVGTYVFTRGPS